MTKEPEGLDISVAARQIDWAALREIAADLAFLPDEEVEAQISFEIDEVLREAATDCKEHGEALTSAQATAIAKLMRARMWKKIKDVRKGSMIV